MIAYWDLYSLIWLIWKPTLLLIRFKLYSAHLFLSIMSSWAVLCVSVIHRHTHACTSVKDLAKKILLKLLSTKILILLTSGVGFCCCPSPFKSESLCYLFVLFRDVNSSKQVRSINNTFHVSRSKWSHRSGALLSDIVISSHDLLLLYTQGCYLHMIPPRWSSHRVGPNHFITFTHT